MSFHRLILWCLVFTLAGCSAGSQTAEAGAEAGDTSSMNEMSNDPAFVNAHPNPDSLSFQGRGQMVTFPTPDGGTGSAYVLQAAENPDNQYLVVIHEWWGLNDYIKREAERLYESLPNTTVMALDLYDGQVATNQQQAQQYMQSVSDARARAIINGALARAGDDADISTIGWCFGGGWSLRTAILAGDRAEAAVMYYGMPVEEASALAPLDAPVLFIAAAKDQWINEQVVQNFQNLARATGKELTVRSFNTDHAFANPSNPAYDAQATREANELALAFLREHM